MWMFPKHFCQLEAPSHTHLPSSHRVPPMPPLIRLNNTSMSPNYNPMSYVPHPILPPPSISGLAPRVMRPQLPQPILPPPLQPLHYQPSTHPWTGFTLPGSKPTLLPQLGNLWFCGKWISRYNLIRPLQGMAPTPLFPKNALLVALSGGLLGAISVALLVTFLMNIYMNMNIFIYIYEYIYRHLATFVPPLQGSITSTRMTQMEKMVPTTMRLIIFPENFPRFKFYIRAT